MPTQAVNDLQQNEIAQEIEPTEAFNRGDEVEFSSSEVISNGNKDEILPTQANLDIRDEKTNLEEDFRQDLESEEPISQKELKKAEENKEINLDKTQDWEI
jgi:hypothetical protein